MGAVQSAVVNSLTSYQHQRPRALLPLYQGHRLDDDDDDDVEASMDPPTFLSRISMVAGYASSNLQDDDGIEMRQMPVTCASLGVDLPAMSSDERIRAIYEDLARQSPFVRRSCLNYDTVGAIETDHDDLGREQRYPIRWMTAWHLYVPILEHNANLLPEYRLHYQNLAGILMVGVRAAYLETVTGMIWSIFTGDTVSFPVYEEDGTPLEMTTTTTTDEHRGREEEEDDDDNDDHDDDHHDGNGEEFFSSSPSSRRSTAAIVPESISEADATVSPDVLLHGNDQNLHRRPQTRASPPETPDDPDDESDSASRQDQSHLKSKCQSGTPEQKGSKAE